MILGPVTSRAIGRSGHDNCTCKVVKRLVLTTSATLLAEVVKRLVFTTSATSFAEVLKRLAFRTSAALLAEVVKRLAFTTSAALLAEVVKRLVFTTPAASFAEVVKRLVFTTSATAAAEALKPELRVDKGSRHSGQAETVVGSTPLMIPDVKPSLSQLSSATQSRSTAEYGVLN